MKNKRLIMKKKYRINSKRLSGSIAFLFLLILLTVNTIFSLAGENSPQKSGTVSQKAQSVISQPSYCEVIIRSGDTIWDIARTYGDSGEDIRKTVYQICRINDIAPEDLQPGQMIRVPAPPEIL